MIFLVFVQYFIESVVPFVIVVVMPRWQWALAAGAIVIGWWLYLKHLTVQTNRHGGPWIFNEAFVRVSAQYAVAAVMTRLLTLRLKQRGYGGGVTVFVHVLGYLAIPAFLYVSRMVP